jgi:hypothetical protein
MLPSPERRYIFCTPDQVAVDAIASVGNGRQRDLP